MRVLEITQYDQGSESHDASERAGQNAVTKEEKHCHRAAHGKDPVEHPRVTKRRRGEEDGAHHKAPDQSLADTGKPVKEWRIGLHPIGNGDSR